MARATRLGKVQPTSELLDYPGPTEYNEPPDDFHFYVLTLFGPKGIGKSTAAAGFPDSLTLMFEPMRRGLSIRQISLMINTASEIVDGAPDIWMQMVNTTQKWLDDPTVKRLNFDSVDLVYEACYHSVLSRQGLTKPSDSKNSADVWNEIRDEFASYFNTLRSCEMSLTFISHVKEREESSLEGGKLGIASPTCTPACLKYLKQTSDIVLYFGWYNFQRAMMVRDQSNAAFVSPGVQGHFLQPDGKNVNIFKIPDISIGGQAPSVVYDTILSAFNNGEWDMDTSEDERTLPSTKPKSNPSGPNKVSPSPSKKLPPTRKGPPPRPKK